MVEKVYTIQFTGSQNYKDISNFIKPVQEVYMICVSMDNFPHLNRVFISELQEYRANNFAEYKNMPYSLALSVFDLEIIAHYLKNPYVFMHYINRRVITTDIIIAMEETSYLYHYLFYKLQPNSEYDISMLDRDHGQLLCNDYRDYTIYKARNGNSNFQSDFRSKIWGNLQSNDVNNFFRQVEYQLQQDINGNNTAIFTLLNLPSQVLEEFLQYIAKSQYSANTKNKISYMRFAPSDSEMIVFVAYNQCTAKQLIQDLLSRCMMIKYQTKKKTCLGVASVYRSNNLVDGLCYIDHQWQYDQVTEELLLQAIDQRMVQ